MVEIEKTLSIKLQCELMACIDKKAKTIIESKSLRGKDEEIFSDIYKMAIREAGSYSLESAEEKYLKAIHNAVLSYRLPAYLETESQKE